VVKIGGAGVCRTDLHIIAGQWAEAMNVALPYTIGHENAGWVYEVGSAVTNVAVGDTVILHPQPSCGLCLACVGNRLLRSCHFLGHQIADRLDLYLFNREQILQQAGTASTDADDPYAHPFSCRERDADHGRVRILPYADIEVSTQSVRRNQESRAADGGALHETSSRNIFRFVIRGHVVTSL